MNKTRAALCLTLLLCILSTASFAEQQQDTACNGSAHLCGKAYNDVTYAAAHNAMSNADDGWFLPNHYHGIPGQLRAGIRMLNIDLYRENGVVMMCHSQCSLGRAPFAAGLESVREFLEGNPRDIVTLTFQSAVPPGDIEACIEAAGLAPMAYAHDGGAQWPTLGDMIHAGTRLVVFSDRDAASPAWLNPATLIGNSPYYHTKIAAFQCGDPGDRPLYNLSHFLYGPHGHPGLAARANREKVVVGRALDCWKRTGKRPNFIMVDFYSGGDVVSAVDKLNAMKQIND